MVQNPWLSLWRLLSFRTSSPTAIQLLGEPMPTVEFQLHVGITQCPDVTAISEARVKGKDAFCIPWHTARERETLRIEVSSQEAEGRCTRGPGPSTYTRVQGKSCQPVGVQSWYKSCIWPDKRYGFQNKNGGCGPIHKLLWEAGLCSRHPLKTLSCCSWGSILTLSWKEPTHHSAACPWEAVRHMLAPPSFI